MDGITSDTGQGFASAAGRLVEKFSEKAVKTAKIAHRILSIEFAFEFFKPLKNKTIKAFPYAEMLARHPDGKSAGHLFDESRECDFIVETDLLAFERAVIAQQNFGFPVSINLSAETFFDKRLFAKLDEIATKYPAFNPKDVCLEITEQGGVPANFDPNALLALKERGFALALDDFDPRQAVEQDRILKFAEYVDVVKFPYQVLDIIRSGSPQDIDDLRVTIEEIKKIQKIPQDDRPIMIVMEGVRSTDEDLLLILKLLDVDYFQETSYVPEPQTPRTAPIAYPNAASLSLALNG